MQGTRATPVTGGHPDRGEALPPTKRMFPPRQRLLALQRANEIRSARAELKRRIGTGQLSAAEVILDCPVEASRWPVAELLASQGHWGKATARKFLARTQISELKPIGELTQRQRHLLAGQLKRCARAKSEFVEPDG
jgi:hypothetical protein